MSKKKPNPMTLKDFHGGTIPSDLPLPSAPGVMVRPADRGGFDRQMSWGNSMGRPDHRLRPSSAGSARTIDDRTPFLSHTSQIGRNFDEDERKPLDGISGPRRTVVDETIRPHSSRSVAAKTVSSSSNTSEGMAGEVHKTGVNLQNYSGSRGYSSNYPNMGPIAGQSVSGSYPNAWGLRKEAVSVKESASAVWSAPAAATKLAHASALEQISSGRWNSKLTVPTLTDANSKNNYDRLDVEGESDYHDVSLVMHAERCLSINDGIRGGGKDKINGGSERRNLSINNGSQSPYPAKISAGTEYPPVLPELSERPKLKLIPRTKPMEKLEQVYQQPSDHLQTGSNYGLHKPVTPAEPVLNGPITSDRTVERPKLNLKPRSQPLEHFEGNSANRKGAVFGGARPRELVLKERGIDDSVPSNYESPSPVRGKEDTSKVDASMHIPSPRQQLDGERNRKTEMRPIEKRRVQQQPLKERAASPESWRKPPPVEDPKTIDTSLRYGKAASAVELAQAFSKSVSDTTKQAERFSGNRGRTQIPFSRLTGPTPRAQLNGY